MKKRLGKLDLVLVLFCIIEPQVSPPPLTEEDWVVIRDDLWQVEVSERPHQDLILRSLWVSPLEGAGDHKNGFDGAKAPVVVVLRRNVQIETTFIYVVSFVDDKGNTNTIFRLDSIPGPGMGLLP